MKYSTSNIPVFKMFGGRDKLYAYLQANGFKRHSINMMVHRGRFSQRAIAQMAVYLTSLGVTVDLDEDFRAAHDTPVGEESQDNNERNQP